MHKVGEVISCGYCHKPLVVKNGMQKYHLECAIEISKEQAREYWKLKKESQRKSKVC